MKIHAINTISMMQIRLREKKKTFYTYLGGQPNQLILEVHAILHLGT